MHASVEKGQDYRARTAHQPSQTGGGSRATAQLVDNRPESIQLLKLQETMDNSPRNAAWSPLQLKSESEPVQRQPEEEELQMKADPVQRQPEEEELQMKADPVQRQPEEEELQMKADPVQRQPEEEELQMKADPVQRQPEEEELQMKADPIQRQNEKNRTGMPDSLKGGMEDLSGVDLSGVRVHYNSAKPSQLNAHAYAQGQDIHLGPGQAQHLPHEAWHTVQQMQGRVKPTMQAHGASINDDKGLEHEADVMGANALARATQRKLESED